MAAETPNAPSDAVRLRGHHFVCLQFFEGQGYSPRFVENLAEVVARVREHPALAVAGPDSVCTACPGLAADGSCLDPQAGEAEVRRIDRLAWEVLDAGPGSALSLAEARRRLSANREATSLWREQACRGCAWEDVCRPGFEELLGEERG
jgi:hypothetical protein